MTNPQDLLRQHGGLVWQTVYRLLAHDADAADCFQETFLSAMEVARRQEVRNWPGLLHRLATTRALDCLRRRYREANRRIELTDWDELPASAANPAYQAQASELAEHLRQALGQLPAQQSEVFCLRHLSGLNYEQIASEMDISVDVVGVTLHRARGRLRELLAPGRVDERTQR